MKIGNDMIEFNFNGTNYFYSSTLRTWNESILFGKQHDLILLDIDELCSIQYSYLITIPNIWVGDPYVSDHEYDDEEPSCEGFVTHIWSSSEHERGAMRRVLSEYNAGVSIGADNKEFDAVQIFKKRDMLREY